MCKASERIASILAEKGFSQVDTTSDIVVDEPYAADLSVLDAVDLSAGASEQKVFSIRSVEYRNEYHDEKLTQVQATVVTGKAGLGSVKALGEEVAAKILGGDAAVELRPEFIYQVVPAIEMKHEGQAFAAGGLVRPEVMRKLGVKAGELVAYVVIFTAENVQKLG